MNIHIVNKKFYKGKCEYIGRPSLLGNPYSHKDKSIALYKTNTVEEAISKYRDWIYLQIALNNENIINELFRLAEIANKGELILGCWCVPFHDCHGYIIKEIIECIWNEYNERMAKELSIKIKD